ncbi:MAG: alpha/beta fold hydrolase [Hyphomicrobiales bacterium]
MHKIDVNGRKLAYRQTGSGPVVIALHSTASDGRQWKSLTAHLKQRFTVITPDLPGYGGSAPWPGKGPASLADDANFIFELIARMGEPVHLVGHSFGAAVALKIAMMRPGWVRSLTVVEPALFHVLRDGELGDKELFREISAIAGTVNAAAAEGNPWAGMARFIDFWNGDGAWTKTHHALRAGFARQISPVINNFAAGFNERWKMKMVRAIQCPVLAIMGLEGPLCAQRVTEMLAENMPNARLTIVPEAGHMVPLTDPHIVDPMICGHLVAADINREKPVRLVQHIPFPKAA